MFNSIFFLLFLFIILSKFIFLSLILKLFSIFSLIFILIFSNPESIPILKPFEKFNFSNFSLKNLCSILSFFSSSTFFGINSGFTSVNNTGSASFFFFFFFFLAVFVLFVKFFFNSLLVFSGLAESVSSKIGIFFDISKFDILFLLFLFTGLRL